MILYAAMAEESVVKMFVAGFLPGILGGLSLMALCYYYAWKNNFPVEQRFSLRKLARATREAAWALSLPVIILGGIFGGFVTATEGAALAVVAALFISVFIYRDINLKALYHALVDSALQTAVVMLLVAASALVGVFLTESQLPQNLAKSIVGITQQSLHGAAAAQYLLLDLGHVPALRGGDHSHSADRHATGAPGRHRPHPFRPGVDAQPRHRPADAAGRFRADCCLLHRQVRHLENDQGQSRIHRGNGRCADAVQLRAVVLVGADQRFLRRLAAEFSSHDPRTRDHRPHFSEGYILRFGHHFRLAPANHQTITPPHPLPTG